jgi:hypothetical protein
LRFFTDLMLVTFFDAPRLGLRRLLLARAHLIQALAGASIRSTFGGAAPRGHELSPAIFVDDRAQAFLVFVLVVRRLRSPSMLSITTTPASSRPG